MNRPAPPVTGRDLERWRTAVRAYRKTLLQGYGHERAVAHAATTLFIAESELGRHGATQLSEAAVAWVLEHRPDWIGG